MIERDFISQKTKEFYIKQYVESKLKGAGISQIKLKKIPLGEKIIIYASRPSLIVGSKGANIRDLTRVLKQDFKLENPQIEINEVKNPYLDAAIVADRIAGSLERFGSARFKSIGHKIMENVMKSGALGIELLISGKIPGARAKSWRFYQGYLKKCGEIATSGVLKAKTAALLKTGIIGVQVSIMPPGIVLPDHVEIKKELDQVVEETPLVGSVPKDSSTEGKESKRKKTGEKAEKSEKKKAPKKKEIKVEEEKTAKMDEAVENKVNDSQEVEDKV